MTEEFCFGIDVSKHQIPSKTDYRGLKAQGTEFVYVRALYGVTPDPKAKAHLVLAREAGMQVGLYAFFRPSLGWQDQLNAFVQAHADLGVGEGDLAPTLDVEDDRSHEGLVISKIAKSWVEPVGHILDGLRLRFGEAILYGYEAGLPVLGDLCQRWPLWVAHYRRDGQERLPPVELKLPWHIHQYGVGPGLEPSGKQQGAVHGALDRNYARKPLKGIRPLSLDPLDGMTLDSRSITGLAVLGNREGLSA